MKRLILILATCILPVVSANAQNTVTIQVNLKPQLVDSIFIPERDRIYVMGNQFPLSIGRQMDLQDTAPVDSIYSVEVNFPANVVGQSIQYNFFMVVDSETRQEQMPRTLRIQEGSRELDALYFDSFAW